MINIFKGAFLCLFVFIIASCNTEEKKINVELDAQQFPQVSINLEKGHSMKFISPSKDFGSIGYRMNGEIQWLTGEPTISETAGKYTLSWDQSDQGVEMTIDLSKKDPVISIQHLTPPTAHNEWLLNLNAQSEEYFTGIFERVVDGSQNESWKDDITTGMNLRGERVEMHLKPTVSAYAPFYISSEGYGLFVQGTWPGVLDFCKKHENVVALSWEGPKLEYKLYQGSPMELVQQHALETGPSLVPPAWALGPWRWRDEHFNAGQYYDGTVKTAPYNTDIVEDVLMMEAYDIPCTAHWIDRPWGPGVRGFDDYEFDEERLPMPEKMISWLNGKNIELMLWIGPFVMGKMADYAEENNYELKSNRWKDSRQVLMDFTNPEAAKWWGENGPGKLAKMGVKGFKLDRADGEKLLDSLHLKTHAGTTYRENFNDYPRQYVEATYNAVAPVLGDDFVLFPRAQYTGSAKYGSMWAGDTNGKPEGLRSAIIALQRCSVMGYPVWGSDIGGYWGDFSQETCKRWLAFGCFSPIMETGPTNNKGFWNNPEAPAYDAELIATWRLYSKLRMKIVPYVSEMAKIARSTGTPIARPLFLEYPDQKESWEDWQTYLFGDDLLVSAIWESGKTMHKLFLPAGETWVDAWSGEEHEGGKYITVDTPLHKMPIFKRKGSTLVLGDLNKLYEESLEIARVKPDLKKLQASENWR
ncbi:TIM-barrel domain-containing protein [Portibacter lacus]|uniref:Alpha-xylosidase n=1 Tax=Portibacter lacus TaxID=1099794 RepID=A0AA37SSM0_9BACT|nr:TIM-barrel domain-containing protein [Portibacter lacus]GLR18969.1 alpha-xylosidase [Portibacter lacus]